MRVLILGGAGMLGHRLWITLRGRHEAFVTLRRPISEYEHLGLFDPPRTIAACDLTSRGDLERAFRFSRPEVVINAAALVPQRGPSLDPVRALLVNAVLPHRLAALCATQGVRLVLVSTDGVFSGKTGSYHEMDLPDPPDLYGRTKLAGEVVGPGVMTLRVCIVGREIEGSRGLVEWFLSQRGQRVRGFSQARFNAITTHTLATLLADLLETPASLEGLWHVGSLAISKLDLLARLDAAFSVGADIVPDPGVRVDRTLDTTLFAERFGWRAPSWDELVDQLARDPLPYDGWRRM
jgi:dTDP-4-dehydrorhamnose reductase